MMYKCENKECPKYLHDTIKYTGIETHETPEVV